MSDSMLLRLCYGFVVILFLIVNKLATLFWEANRREVARGWGSVVSMSFVILRGAPLCLLCVSMLHAMLHACNNSC